MDEEIKNFLDKNHIEFAPSQKDAIRGAVKNGVEIITGGPGTGKTTIINCIIQLFEKANYKVLMGAPTGRAAKRMSEATEREAKRWGWRMIKKPCFSQEERNYPFNVMW